MDHNTSVLDVADEETVALATKLQLCDVDSATDGEMDHHVATRLCKAELEEHKLIHGPHDDALDTAVESSAVETSPPGSVQLFECKSCLDRYTAESGYQAPCHHFYCDADLATLFRTAMHDRSFYPPKCCGSEIRFDEVEELLEKDLASAFTTMKPELDDETPMYCSSSTCSSYIPSGNRKQDTVKCDCGTTTCTSCKAAAHDGDCPNDEALQLTLALAEREGWRRCNECKRMVELSVGCYHMT